MLQAQSLPDTGWPTYCLSPLFLFHTTPPIKTTSIHCHSNPRPPPSPSPRSFSPSYLRELGVNQSFVGPCMLLQLALLHGHSDYLQSAGGRAGMGWRGGGHFLEGVGTGISCAETRNSKWRRFELRWPFLWQSDCKAPGALFPSSSLFIHPSSFSYVPLSSVTQYTELWLPLVLLEQPTGELSSIQHAVWRLVFVRTY